MCCSKTLSWTFCSSPHSKKKRLHKTLKSDIFHFTVCLHSTEVCNFARAIIIQWCKKQHMLCKRRLGITISWLETWGKYLLLMSFSKFMDPFINDKSTKHEKVHTLRLQKNRSAPQLELDIDYIYLRVFFKWSFWTIKHSLEKNPDDPENLALSAITMEI